MRTALEEQGREAEERGQRGEKNRAKALLRAFDDRRRGRRSPVLFPADEVDHHQRVVDHDTAHAEHAPQGDHAEREPHGHVTQQRAGEPERDDGHDDQRPRVGTERHRKQPVDQQQREDEAACHRRHDLGPFLLLPPEGVGEPRMGCGQLRQYRRLQKRASLRTRDHVRVDVGADRHDAPPVLAVDGRGRGAQGHFGHLAQRHDGPSREVDRVVLHVGDGVPLVGGQTDVDGHVLPTPPHSNRLHAEERGAHLPRHVFQHQPQRARFRSQLDPEFRKPGRMVRLHVVDTLKIAQAIHHGRADRTEQGGLRMEELDQNGSPHVQQLRTDGEALRAADGRRLCAPACREVPGVDGCRLAGPQLDLNRCAVGRRRHARFEHETAVPSGPHADAPVDPDEQRLGVHPRLRRQPLDGAPAGCLELARRRIGPLRRRPLRQLQSRGHDVAVHRGQEALAHDACRHEREAEQGRSKRCRNHDLGSTDRQAQRAIEGTVHEPLQRAVHAKLDGGKEVLHPVARHPRRRQMRQMPRQDEQGFDQRYRQHRDHQHGGSLD